MKKFILAFFISLSLVLVSQNAFAYGVGLYLEPAFLAVRTGTQSLTAFKGGLMFDNCMSKNNLLNFRVNLGMGYASSFNKSEYLADAAFALGFRIYRNDYIRFWTGPQIGAMFCSGNYPYAGLILGMNVKLGDHASMLLDFGGAYQQDISRPASEASGVNIICRLGFAFVFGETPVSIRWDPAD